MRYGQRAAREACAHIPRCQKQAPRMLICFCAHYNEPGQCGSWSITEPAKVSPLLAKTMPTALPWRPSHTEIMTPAVSTSSATDSSRVGVLPSMPTARMAVATGMADLQTELRCHCSNQGIAISNGCQYCAEKNRCPQSRPAMMSLMLGTHLMTWFRLRDMRTKLRLFNAIFIACRRQQRKSAHEPADMILAGTILSTQSMSTCSSAHHE